MPGRAMSYAVALFLSGVIVFASVLFIKAGVSAILPGYEICKIENQNRAVEYGKVAPYPDGTPRHLDWFVQISDIHINQRHNREIGPDLEIFCNALVNIIKPRVTLATGDLTDAKPINEMDSRQDERDWKEYRHILQTTGVTNHTVWLDTRGNHDSFSVASWDSKENFYEKYAIQGKRGRFYRHDYSNVDGDHYTFISVDAAPEPGPKRPFNFFGHLYTEMLTKLESHMTASCRSNMTIWFGHYPTSVISSDSPGIVNLFSNGAVYMCGHLHRMFGLVPRMYARHSAGNLQLEVGDWKLSRVYRIFAIDHGLFSFIDDQFESWPAILITNPKNAEFRMPRYEPLGKIMNSTHIRVLVFSKAVVVDVRVWLDGLWAGEARHSAGPLYVLSWRPERFLTGLHSITVKAKDADEKTRTVSHLFCIDYCPVVNSKLFSRFILLTDFNTLLPVSFLLLWLVALLPLVAMKMFRARLYLAVRADKTNCLTRFLQTWLRRSFLLASANSIICSLIAFTVYVAIGPWFVGEIINGYMGVCFVFGQIVYGSFIPDPVTYLHGYLQLVTFNIPLALYLACCLDRPDYAALTPVSKWRTFLRWTGRHFIFFVLIAWQSFLAVFGTFAAYGYVALVVCPVRTWSVGMAIVLRHVALSKAADPNWADLQYVRRRTRED